MKNEIVLSVTDSSRLVSKKETKNTIKSFLKKNWLGYLCISPVMLGILIFTLVPIIMSLYYSFFDYSVISDPTNFGFHNYIAAFTTEWHRLGKSLAITFTFAIINIPLVMVLSYSIALFLSQKMKVLHAFRIVCFIPGIIPAVISGMIWMDMTDYTYGILNGIITSMGLPAWGMFREASTSLPTFIFLNLFGIGSNIILWIAQFKNIPDTLYEAASIEGASSFDKVAKITIPLSTPMIFYVLITGIIGCLQVFTASFLVAGTGVEDSMLFYVVYTYNQAFQSFKMGYACALSWILFVIIAILTAFIFKSSKWVFYGDEE